MTNQFIRGVSLQEDNCLVELAMMQEYEFITVRAHSKYSSPNFAHKNPNRKLRGLVDLRRKYHLIKIDYGEHDHRADKPPHQK